MEKIFNYSGSIADGIFKIKSIGKNENNIEYEIEWYNDDVSVQITRNFINNDEAQNYAIYAIYSCLKCAAEMMKKEIEL